MKLIGILRSKRGVHRKQEKLLEVLEKKGNKDFLQNLLEVMRLKSSRDTMYRRGIKDFFATYVFEGEGKYAVVYFKNGKLTVSDKRTQLEPDFEVIFKDEKGLYKLLLGEAYEYEEALTHREVICKGNINYIRRFSFMAKEAMR